MGGQAREARRERDPLRLTLDLDPARGRIDAHGYADREREAVGRHE